jgi:hypothetical protein
MATASATFRPDAPTDLVLPEQGSTTARAIHSLGQRALFEWLKRGPFPADVGAELQALRSRLAGFLPGRPKVVSSLLEEPAFTVHLRRMRAGEAGERAGRHAAAQAFFALAAKGELDAEVVVADPPARLFCVDPLASLAPPRGAASVAIGPSVRAEADDSAMPIEGRGLVAVAGAEAFDLRGPRLEGAELTRWVLALRGGLGALRHALPGVAAALERVTRVITPSGDPPGSARVAPRAIGVLAVPSSGDRAALAESLGRGTAATLLHALRELDPLGPDDAFDALVCAAELAVADALHRTPASKHALAPALDALAAHDGRLTDVGRGVRGELVRRAAPSRDKKGAP